MRIAMVSEHASPLAALGGADAGGQNVYVAELSAELARLGHEVTVYTRRDNTSVPARVTTPLGVTIVHVPAGPPQSVPKDELLPYMGAFGRFLAEEWRETCPHVVHAHFWMSGLASALAARQVNVPVVQTYHALGVVKHRHQGELDTSPAERLRIERLVGQAADRILATCSDEVFELVRMGVPRVRMSVVPCGVDIDEFSPEGPAAPRRAKHRLLAVGRLVQRKGFDLAVSALRGLPGTELVIAGGADQKQLADDREACRLIQHAKRLGVADRVRLLGRVARADMPALLRSADVVVCSPWYEPFGIVPLEAMACGVPVVATAVGGLTDTIVDGITGLHVPPRQPTALRKAIRALLADETCRAAVGAAGRDRACSRYSWSRITGEVLRVYEQTLADRGRMGDAACRVAGEKVMKGVQPPHGTLQSHRRRQPSPI